MKYNNEKPIYENLLYADTLGKIRAIIYLYEKRVIKNHVALLKKVGFTANWHNQPVEGKFRVTQIKDGRNIIIDTMSDPKLEFHEQQQLWARRMYNKTKSGTWLAQIKK